MAKMRVHELAKELDKQSKEIVAFLAAEGISKSPSSNLEDSEIDIVKKHFKGASSAPKAEAPKAAPKAEAPKAAPKAEAPKAEAPKAAAPAQAPQGEAPKKKKSNIFISGSKGQSQQRGGRPMGQGSSQGGARPAQSKPSVSKADIMAAFNKTLGNAPAQAPKTEAPVQEAPKAEAPKAEAPKAAPAAEAPKAPERPVGPRIIRHEDPAASTIRTVQNNGAGGSRDKRNDSRGNQQRGAGANGDQRNTRPGQKDGKKSNISFSGGGSSYRSGDNRFQGQRGNGRPQAGPQGGPQGFNGGPSAKDAAGKNARNRKGGNVERGRRDYDREEEQLKSKKFNPHGFHKPEKPVVEEEKIKVITLPEVVTIRELAEKMKIQPAVIIKKLFLTGQMVTVNSELSYEDAENIAADFEILCEQEEKVDVIAELLKEEDEAEEKMVTRPPVVCVMGHVDHGKTSLLDAVRKTNVIDREAGGITQHIGAYTVNINGSAITFLDTPGHEAFTAMRMRGANSTDIAILVVAADDGVMPQTVEAINHAKAAGIEIIVAVNKIDKPSANVDRVKQELAEYELIPEDWGGSTIFAEVSAKTGQGITDLLEMVLLTAEVLELKANPNRQARGLVIEAELDKGRGPVATVLVQKGTLHIGDFIAAGACHGKVRAMVDDKGRRVKAAGPSTPVEILGLNDVPNAGEVFVSPESDKEAKNFADTFISQNRQKLLDDTKTRMTLDDVFSQIKEGNLKELNIIVKADVQGSVEAVKTSLVKLSNDEVVVKVIHSGVGAINESDVILASASNAIIIGFNVRPDATAKGTAETEGVDVRLYRVIYQAIEDVEAAMKGMLDPIFEEKVIGHAEIRQIFKASGVGNIAGSYVLDGVFERGCSVRITREGELIHEGPLASLKRFKDDVKEVKSGFECGLVFEGWGDMQELDIVEAYKMVEVPR